MATRKQKSLELNSQTDPKAPLDGAALLRAAKPVLTLLQADLLERADNSPNVTATLHEQHERALKADRTADDYLTWRRNFVEQVAAAWFLSVVFVRTLEDRKLIARNRIAGEGALDSQKSFFALAPSLSERDYLLTVFRELSHLPAAADLFDARHNPVWLLAPSAHAAQQLLQLFRTPSDVAPAFRFGGDTRFLGDLYQDLSEDVRARYALLQTPHFVESFILDQTLEPAIERFGLNDATLIDPTCGSGHFLLGAFERLLTHRLSAEPGVDVRQAARKALDAVSGTDINPYAVSIARFRLTLSFLERAGYTQLRDAPKLPLHLAVADSLLHNYQHGLDHATGDSDKYQQTRLGETATTDIAAWEGDLFTLEDLAQTREVLGRRYAAVVGNPPYITVKDAKLRDKYREMYSAAFREYSLAVPFKQRFFQLGRQRGYVGMITANSFMKREFGKKVIQEFLPSVNLTTIINTSGAYIPGHGTPTVLLFGTAEKPVDDQVLTVLANRGEPSTPDDAEQGYVWRSIADHHNEIGFENEYISVTQTERAQLSQHPWSLAGGGASELKELLEERAAARLSDVSEAIGFVCMTRADDIYFVPRDALRRAGISEKHIIENVEGEVVRDWAISSPNTTLFPYEDDLAPTQDRAVHHFLWPYRAMLWLRREPNGNHREIGLTWWEWSRFQRERYTAPLKITFAFVATHNHFVLDRGGKVFKQSAPIIKLPASATEDDHYALLAYLNSSTACFWMKQVCHNKTNASQKHSTDPARAAYEFAGTALGEMPVYPMPERVRSFAKQLLELGERRAAWLSGTELLSHLEVIKDVQQLTSELEAGWARYDERTQRCVYLQEEIDWAVYEAAGLCKSSADKSSEPFAAALGSRPFEVGAGYQSGVSARATKSEANEMAACPPAWQPRVAMLQDRNIAQLETRQFKRMWRDTEQNVDQAEFRRSIPKTWLVSYVAQQCELGFGTSPASLAALELKLPPAASIVAQYLNTSLRELVRQISTSDAVPYLDAWVYTETGLEKRQTWQKIWDLQRQEDAGQPASIPEPPDYSQGSRGKSKDFQRDEYWRLRGKLDVPKERFIAYPGCESDEDGQPIYGWAGWNHRQRAVALATLYTQRKSEEGWKKERLQPMLAGLLELLPWLDQWHNQPDADFDGAIPAAQFREFLDAECAEHGFTYEDLRNWRPTRTAGGKKKAAPSSASADSSDETPARKPKRAAKSRSLAPALDADDTAASLADDADSITASDAKPKRARKRSTKAAVVDSVDPNIADASIADSPSDEPTEANL